MRSSTSVPALLSMMGVFRGMRPKLDRSSGASTSGWSIIRSRHNQIAAHGATSLILAGRRSCPSELKNTAIRGFTRNAGKPGSATVVSEPRKLLEHWVFLPNEASIS